MLVDFLKDHLGEDAADVVIKLLVVIAVLLLTWLIRQFVSAIFPALIRRITGRTATSLDNQIIDALLPPVRFIVSVAGLWVAVIALELPAPVRRPFGIVLTSLAAYAVFWGVYRLVEPVVRLFVLISRRTMRETSIPTLLGDQLVVVLQQILKALVIVFGMAAVFEIWGYNVSGLVAGLGLGGLAFALAAQNTLENLLGYFVILADAPLRVGEYVVFGDISGTVESIGFRSTRIRALDQTLVSVPNKTIMNANVSNSSRLTKRRLNMTLGLGYGNSPKQILAAIQDIRQMLKSHKLVQADSVIVQFSDLGKETLDILIICFMNTPAWNDFQAAKQDINLRIMTLLAARSISVTPAGHYLNLEAALPPEAKPARPLPPPVPEPAISSATDSPVPDDAAN
jgi:MscS family membrane protein